MKLIEIDKIKDYLFNRSDVTASYIFGSYAAEKPTRLSDLDIATLLDSRVERENYGMMKLDIIGGLIELLSFDKIDVTILNIAPPLLSHEILKKGMLLFVKDANAFLEYKAKATMRYLDTIYLRRVQDRILHEKIRSRDFGYFKGSYKYSIEKVRKGSTDTSAIR